MKFYLDLSFQFSKKMNKKAEEINYRNNTINVLNENTKENKEKLVLKIRNQNKQVIFKEESTSIESLFAKAGYGVMNYLAKTTLDKKENIIKEEKTDKENHNNEMLFVLKHSTDFELSISNIGGKWELRSSIGGMKLGFKANNIEDAFVNLGINIHKNKFNNRKIGFEI